MVLISVVCHLITPWNTIWNSGFHHKHQPKDSQMIICYFITENECLPNNNNNNNSKMMKNSQADVSNKICIQSSLRQFFSKNTCLNMWKNLWGVILPNCYQWSLMLLSSRGSHWLRCLQQSFSHSTNINQDTCIIQMSVSITLRYNCTKVACSAIQDWIPCSGPQMGQKCNGFFNRPTMAHTQIVVKKGGKNNELGAWL